LQRGGFRRSGVSAASLSCLAEAASTLRNDEIHVWRVGYRPTLGRQPLLHVLAAYLGCDGSAVDLESEEHGRPRLAARFGHAIDFNWSHSGTDALIAIGRHVRPGVDVERMRPRPRLLEIARRYFEPAECSLLEELAGDERLAMFLGMWTAKEAVLKALGRGLAFGLDRVGIDTRDDVLALRRLDGNDVRSWQLQSLAVGPGVFAALAWQGEPRCVRTGLLAAID
jgi:4'-phosphopantetheinyl transferase